MQSLSSHGIAHRQPVPGTAEVPMSVSVIT
jgi:hypothetical protein